MTIQVSVDAQSLWFILQQYKDILDNKCPSSENLTVWRDEGYYRGEYSIICKMERQIREVL